MSFSDWDAIWKRQVPPIGAAADVEELRRTFEAKRRKRACTLAIRDYSESFAGLVVALVLGLAWWKMGSTAWPLGVSIGITACVSIRFLLERARIRRSRLGPDAPMLDKLDNEISELRRQLEFHRGLFKWYLAPLLLAWAIAMLAFARVADLKTLSRFIRTGVENPVAGSFILLYVGVIVPLCFWASHRNISRGIRKGIIPRLEELEKLRADMEGKI